MPSELIDFLVQLGIGGIAFACFYLIHKSSTTQIDSIIQNQKEQQKEMFDILKQMIEQNNLQLAYLQEIKTLVNANLWCPYVKEHSGILERNKQ